MAIELADYVPVLRREVSPPGSTLFATVADPTMEGYLSDAFWEARLDGFLCGYSCSPTGVVTPLDPNGPDLPREQIALVVLYAGLKILRNQLINQTSRFSAKAGPVSFETENSANLMTEMAKQLSAIRDRLLAVNVDDHTLTFLIDGYSIRNSPQYALYSEYAGYVGDTLYEALGTGTIAQFDLGESG